MFVSHVVSFTTFVCPLNPIHTPQDDPQGAFHLAKRLNLLDPEGAGSIVDLTVYSHDREMRTIYSSKREKSQSRLVPLFLHPDIPKPPLRDYFITWQDDADTLPLINVPVHIPRSVKQSRSRVSSAKETNGDALSAHRRVPSDHPDNRAHLGFVKGRILELLQQKVHASGYLEWHRGDEDPYNPALGVKGNYSDRSEPCFTGCVHPGKQNFCCYIRSLGDDAQGPLDQVFVRCFSANCKGRPFLLGPLYDDRVTAFEASALRVSMPFIDASFEPAEEPAAEESAEEPAEEPAAVEPAAVEPPEDFEPIAVEPPATDYKRLMGSLLSGLLGGTFNALCIKSPMGKGKSTLLRKLISECCDGLSILFPTYRVALAAELSKKVGDLGFVCYNEVSGMLDDRKKYPRVICQVCGGAARWR
jgi:hypothetical protein